MYHKAYNKYIEIFQNISNCSTKSIIVNVMGRAPYDHLLYYIISIAIRKQLDFVSKSIFGFNVAVCNSEKVYFYKGTNRIDLCILQDSNTGP